MNDPQLEQQQSQQHQQNRQQTGSPIIIIIKAVLFDLDGTLLDTETLSDRAIGKALQQYHLIQDEPIHSNNKCEEQFVLPWSLKKQILGLPGNQWVPMVLQYYGNQKATRRRTIAWDLHSCHNDYNKGNSTDKNQDLDHDDDDNGTSWSQIPSVDDFWNCWEMHLNQQCSLVEPCPGACQLIQQFLISNHTKTILPDNDGEDNYSEHHHHRWKSIHSNSDHNMHSNHSIIPLAIVTSSRRNAVAKKRIRHEATIFQYMSVIVTGEDVSQGKPAPDIYIEAARRLDICPTQCMVVEDSMAGVMAGKAAGCFVVAVPDPRCHEQDRIAFAQVANIVLTSLHEFQDQLRHVVTFSSTST